MIIKKLTEGVVEQVYDTEKGCFVSQRFIADNLCEYEDDEDPSKVNRDKTTDYMADKYLPFDMVQPVQEMIVRLDLGCIKMHHLDCDALEKCDCPIVIADETIRQHLE